MRTHRFTRRAADTSAGRPLLPRQVFVRDVFVRDMFVRDVFVRDQSVNQQGGADEMEGARSNEIQGASPASTSTRFSVGRAGQRDYHSSDTRGENSSQSSSLQSRSRLKTY